MRFIGITGGVGAGKSSILQYLEENYNCKVVRADQVAGNLRRKDSPVFPALCRLFEGYDVFTPKGELDSAKIAGVIFSDPGMLDGINGILHPAVRSWIEEDVARERAAGKLDAYFLEAALLIETGYEEILDEIWYIHTSEEIRRQRLKENRGYSDEKIDGIFASQLTEAEFLTHSQHVIDNNHSMEESLQSLRQVIKDAGVF